MKLSRRKLSRIRKMRVQSRKQRRYKKHKGGRRKRKRRRSFRRNTLDLQRKTLKRRRKRKRKQRGGADSTSRYKVFEDAAETVVSDDAMSVASDADALVAQQTAADLAAVSAVPAAESCALFKPPTVEPQEPQNPQQVLAGEVFGEWGGISWCHGDPTQKSPPTISKCGPTYENDNDHEESIVNSFKNYYNGMKLLKNIATKKPSVYKLGNAKKDAKRAFEFFNAIELCPHRADPEVPRPPRWVGAGSGGEPLITPDASANIINTKAAAKLFQYFLDPLQYSQAMATHAAVKYDKALERMGTVFKSVTDGFSEMSKKNILFIPGQWYSAKIIKICEECPPPPLKGGAPGDWGPADDKKYGPWKTNPMKSAALANLSRIEEEFITPLMKLNRWRDNLSPAKATLDDLTKRIESLAPPGMETAARTKQDKEVQNLPAVNKIFNEIANYKLKCIPTATQRRTGKNPCPSAAKAQTRIEAALAKAIDDDDSPHAVAKPIIEFSKLGYSLRGTIGIINTLHEILKTWKKGLDDEVERTDRYRGISLRGIWTQRDEVLSMAAAKMVREHGKASAAAAPKQPPSQPAAADPAAAAASVAAKKKEEERSEDCRKRKCKYLVEFEWTTQAFGANRPLFTVQQIVPLKMIKTGVRERKGALHIDMSSTYMTGEGFQASNPQARTLRVGDKVEVQWCGSDADAKESKAAKKKKKNVKPTQNGGATVDGDGKNDNCDKSMPVTMLHFLGNVGIAPIVITKNGWNILRAGGEASGKWLANLLANKWNITNLRDQVAEALGSFGKTATKYLKKLSPAKKVAADIVTIADGLAGRIPSESFGLVRDGTKWTLKLPSRAVHGILDGITSLGKKTEKKRASIMESARNAAEATAKATAEGLKTGRCAIESKTYESRYCIQRRIDTNFQDYILKIYFALAAIWGGSIFSNEGSNKSDVSSQRILLLYKSGKIKPLCRDVNTKNINLPCVGWAQLTYSGSAKEQEGGAEKVSVDYKNMEKKLKTANFNITRLDNYVYQRTKTGSRLLGSITTRIHGETCYEYTKGTSPEKVRTYNIEDLLQRIITPTEKNVNGWDGEWKAKNIPTVPPPTIGIQEPSRNLTWRQSGPWKKWWKTKRNIFEARQDCIEAADGAAKVAADRNAEQQKETAGAILEREKNKKYPLGIRGNIKILKNEIALCKKQLKIIDDKFKIIINPKCLDIDNKDRDEKCIELWGFVNTTFQNLFNTRVHGGLPLAQGLSPPGSTHVGGASYMRRWAGKAKGAVASAATTVASKVKSSLTSYTPPIKPTYPVQPARSWEDALDKLGSTLKLSLKPDQKEPINFEGSLKEYLKGKSPKMQQDILEKMRDIIKQPFKDKCKTLNDMLTIATTYSSPATIARKRLYMLEQIPLLKEKAESATASAATSASTATAATTQGGGLNVLTGGAQTATPPTIGDITQINASLKPDESWDAIEKGLINAKLNTIATSGMLKEGRQKKLDDIWYSSVILGTTAATPAKDLLQRRADGWPAEFYAQRLLKAIVETWVLQDYYKQLETDSNTLGISAPTSSKSHAWSHGLDLGRTGPSRSSRGPSLLSRMGSLFSRKHLNHLNKCPACGSADCASGVEQEVEECKKTPSCIKRMNDAGRIIDIMIRPSTIAPYYDVVVYQNPVGQSAANIVSKAAAAATGLSRGKPPIPTAQQTAAATNIQALVRGHAARQSTAQQRAQTSAPQPNVVLFQGQGQTMSGNPVTTSSLPIATAFPIPEAQIVPTQFQPSANDLGTRP